MLASLFTLLMLPWMIAVFMAVFIGLGYMNHVLRKHDNMQIAVVIGLLVLGVVTMVTGVHYDIVLLRIVGLAEVATSFTDLATLIVYNSGREIPLGGDAK